MREEYDEQRRKKETNKNRYNSKGIKQLDISIKQESIKFTVEMYSVAVAMVLRDKYRFGEVRMKRIMKEITEQFEMITEGYVSLDDMKKVLLEEVKIKF